METNENFPNAGAAAWYVSKNVTYAATASEPFQRFDPLWVIAAHALEARVSVKISTSYDPEFGWRKAFDGLAKIAALQNVTLTRQRGATGRPGVKCQRVALDPAKLGTARAVEAEKVVDDIRNPGPQPKDGQKDAVAHGVKTLPRLYVMSALMIEKAQNKAVVALIVDSCGSVRSVGA